MDPELRAMIAASLARRDPMAAWESDPLNPGVSLDQVTQPLSPELERALQEMPSEGEMLMQRWGERPTRFAEDMLLGMARPFFETGQRIGKNIANYDPNRPPVSQVLDAEAVTPAAQMASQYAPGGSLSDYLFGTGEGFDPFAKNVREGDYGEAAGQLQGAVGDFAAIAGGPLAAIIVGLGNDAGRQMMEAISKAGDKYEGEGAAQRIWDDFGVFQGPSGRFYKEYKDTYSVPSLDELIKMAEARGASGPEDAWTVGDVMPNRGDSFFDDYPDAAGTQLLLQSNHPQGWMGGTDNDGSSVSLSAIYSPEQTIPHEITHLAAIQSGVGAQGGNPAIFDPNDAYFDRSAYEAAQAANIDDPMLAYMGLEGEAIARMAGARRGEFLKTGEWPSKAPFYDLDVDPSMVYARPDEMTGEPLLPAYKNIWWDPVAAKAEQEAADAKAAALIEEMRARNKELLAGMDKLTGQQASFTPNSTEGLRGFGQLPPDELVRRGYSPDQKIFDWYNSPPSEVPDWQDYHLPDPPEGYGWGFGQLDGEELRARGYPLGSKIYDWKLEFMGPSFSGEMPSRAYGPETPLPAGGAPRAPRSTGPEQASILTYHGSPNSWEFDRFDPKRVGTGSGTGEGWGAYSAQEPLVADRYRDWDQEYGKMGTRAYALDLPGEPADYLDLHRSFADQEPAIVAKLETLFGPKPENVEGTLWSAMPRDMIGQPNKQAIEPPWMSEQEASRRLYDAGIIGSRYKDKRSQIGQGDTWNFVNFRPEDVRILGSTDGDIGELVKRFQNSTDRQQMSLAIEGINERLAGFTRAKKPGKRFVGAPDGIDTPEKQEKLISSLMDRVTSQAGLAGKDFYSDYQNAIRGATNDPDMARDLASLTGHTSPQTTPEQNHNYAVRGLNQQTVGDEVKTGMFSNANQDRIQRSLAEKRLPDDPKTGQYAYNLIPPELRPDDYSEYAPVGGRTDRPVHDTWDFRAFGYSNVSGSSNLRRHEYMDAIYDEMIARLNADPKTRELAGPGGWNVENTQAAIWASMRDEAKGAGEKIPDVKDAQAIFDNAKGITQMAAIPGRSTGVDERLLNAPLEQKEAYTKTMFDALSDEDGASIIARSLGLSTPMREGYGPWQGMMEPNRVIDVGVSGSGSGSRATVDKKTGGVNQPRAIDPASDLVARTVRRWHQIALGQEGSGFTYPYGVNLTKGDRNLGVVEGMQLNGREDYNRAFEAAQRVWGDDFADKVVVQPSVDGKGLMMKDITGDNAAFQKNMAEFSRIMGGGEPRLMKDVGNQFDYVRWDNPEYRSLLDETAANPSLKAIFDAEIIPALKKVQDTSEQWARETGIPANTVPDRLRSVIIQGGPNWPAAIEAAVKKGIIPSVAGIVAYNAMLRHAGQEASQSGSH